MEVLGTQCVACDTKRKYKSLAYHPDNFQAYCKNQYMCNDKHINSPANIIKRQEQVPLLEYEDAKSLFSTTVIVDKSDKLKRLLSNPLTVRIHAIEMAEFLVNDSEKSGLNLSDLVRGYIQSRMDNNELVQPKPKVEQRVVINNDDLIF